MNHPAHDDWSQLGIAWRAREMSPPVDALRRRVRAQTRRLYGLVMVEALVTITAVIAIVATLIRSNDLESRLIAAGLGLFTVAVCGFAIRNRRGIWRATGDTTAAYLALERDRLLRRIASARFAWRVSVAGLGPLIALLITRVARSGWSPEALIILAGSIYLVGWIIGGRVVEIRLRRRAGASAGSLSDDDPE